MEKIPPLAIIVGLFWIVGIPVIIYFADIRDERQRGSVLYTGIRRNSKIIFTRSVSGKLHALSQQPFSFAMNGRMYSSSAHPEWSQINEVRDISIEGETDQIDGISGFAMLKLVSSSDEELEIRVVLNKTRAIVQFIVYVLITVVISLYGISVLFSSLSN